MISNTVDGEELHDTEELAIRLAEYRLTSSSGEARSGHAGFSAEAILGGEDIRERCAMSSTEINLVSAIGQRFSDFLAVLPLGHG